MKRVAVFGNAGGGKSRLARSLAERTGLPLHVLDMLQFKPGGEAVPHQEFLKIHAEILERETWILDGYGTLATLLERLAIADTLIHLDLPLILHGWWVTKRLIKGMFKDPEGWPERSPLWASSLAGYAVLLACHRELTPFYRQLMVEAAATKRVHRLTSPRQISTFLKAIEREFAR